MFGKTPPGGKPAPPRSPEKPAPAPAKRRRDLAREDADSPTAIPLNPPQGDGS